MVYHHARHLLREELGLEPTAPLKTLEQAILRQDPGLEWSPTQLGPVAAQPGEPEEHDETGHVLVVDDSSINRRLLVAALAKLGYEVSTADNGLRALELLRGDRFDVVLLDLRMPGMDGLATLQAIKQDETLRHLSVIMISAVHEQESLVRCIELDAADYLPKPFSAAVLRARLRTSLAAKRLRDLEIDYLQRMTRQTSQELDIQAPGMSVYLRGEVRQRGPEDPVVVVVDRNGLMGGGATQADPLPERRPSLPSHRAPSCPLGGSAPGRWEGNVGRSRAGPGA